MARFIEQLIVCPDCVAGGLQVVPSADANVILTLCWSHQILKGKISIAKDAKPNERTTPHQDKAKNK